MAQKITILVIAGIILAGILFFLFGRGHNDWKRLDCKAYSAMDDLALLKRMAEIDCTTRKEVDIAGGEEAMIARVGGKLDEKERKRFVNLVFLNDAFAGMGASSAVLTAVYDRAGCADYLKTGMTVDDVAAVLPVVAELYEILCGIDTSPSDIAEWLVDDYIDKASEEKRATVARRIRKYNEVRNSIMRLWMLHNLSSRR